MAYDILIKSGTLIDGTGNSPFVADLAISGDEIAAIGDLKKAEARVVINMSGKCVTPGFIDITNHSDTNLTLFSHPTQESMLMQGVTTVIGGNCGASLAPLASHQAINAIRKWADPARINLNWSRVSEFLQNIETMRLGVNFGTKVGYGTIRRGVIGDAVRPLDLEEREQVKQLLADALAEGALGLSLGLSYGHERVAGTEEIVELVKVVARYRRTVAIHLRSEGAEFLASVNEAVRIAREAEVSVEISHMKAIGKKIWPQFPKALELISAARASSININYDVSPYRTTGSLLYLLVPGWARQGGFSELFKKIDKLEERKKILEVLQSHTLHYEKITILTAQKTKSVVGHSIAELAEEGGISPAETILELIRANDGRVVMLGRTVSIRNVKSAIRDENSFVVSDGFGVDQEAYTSGDLIHPRSFGAFPRFLSKFVRELGLSPEFAIKKITSGPAGKFGIEKRGILKKNYYADVVVFDPKLIKDRATYLNPYRYPAGVEWVIVNGKVVVENGRLMGVKAGQVVKAS